MSVDASVARGTNGEHEPGLQDMCRDAVPRRLVEMSKSREFGVVQTVPAAQGCAHYGTELFVPVSARRI